MSDLLIDKVERRKRANEARLNAIQQKIKKNDEEQSQIKNSLKGLDSDSKKSTHIRFSDSDDSDCASTKPESKKPNADQLLGFLDEDSSDEEITIKPQFHGKDGSKLLELQSSYGNDARFKIDERFASGPNDETGDDNKNLEEKLFKASENVTDELSKNMKLLNEVIGHDVSSHDQQKRKADKFVDVSTLRYDPLKGAHLEIKPSKEKSSPTKKKKKKEKKQEVIEVDKNRFFKTSSNVLKDAFAAKSENNDSNQTEEKPFSILAMLGRDDNTERNKPSSTKENASEEEGFRFSFPSSKEESIPTFEKKFKYDSSDTDEDEIIDEEMETVEKTKSNISIITSGEKESQNPKTFFMTSTSDSRIIEGVKAFCWNKSFEQMRDEWLEVKDTLMKDYKKKHRDAKRKAQKAKYEAKQQSMTSLV